MLGIRPKWIILIGLVTDDSFFSVIVTAIEDPLKSSSVCLNIADFSVYVDSVLETPHGEVVYCVCRFIRSLV